MGDSQDLNTYKQSKETDDDILLGKNVAQTSDLGIAELQGIYSAHSQTTVLQYQINPSQYGQHPTYYPQYPSQYSQSMPEQFPGYGYPNQSPLQNQPQVQNDPFSDIMGSYIQGSKPPGSKK